MSRTTVIYSLVTALVRAEEIIGPARAWQAVNRTQALFLSEFLAVLATSDIRSKTREETATRAAPLPSSQSEDGARKKSVRAIGDAFF